MTFLHTFAEYGPADWTYPARATDTTGHADNSSIVFTAAFSKLVGPKTVRTTLIGFNRGWTSRYANIYRLGTDGTLNPAPVLPSMPLAIGPKRLRLLTQDFPIN